MKISFLRFILASMLLGILAGCASIGQPARPHLSIAEVIQLSQQKVPDAQIIQRMREDGTIYQLSASQLADLRQMGVPNTVIDYMQQTYLRYAERQGARDAYWNNSHLHWGLGYGYYGRRSGIGIHYGF